MHRSGIDCHEKPRLPNQRRQGEQICFSGEIDDLLVDLILDCGDMRLLAA